MWIRWGGIVSNHRNLSIFTFTSPIALTVCLPWQRLFSDQLCADLASAPFPLLCPLRLHSCLLPAKQACTSSREEEREKEGRMEREGKDGTRQRTSGKKKFPSQSEENFWCTKMMHGRSTVYPIVPSVKCNVWALLNTQKNNKMAIHSTNLWLCDHRRLAAKVPEQNWSKVSAVMWRELVSSRKTKRLKL